MTNFRLYLDEDTTNNQLLRALRNRGADVISTVEANQLAQSDEAQLVWALNHQRVIYSFNVRDFYRLHTEWLTQGKNHAGIILGRQDFSIGEQMKGLLRLITSPSGIDMQNKLVFLREIL